MVLRSAVSLLGALLLCSGLLTAQPVTPDPAAFSPAERTWVPDNNDGTYSNPVIYADYSDPDVIRVGDDYYMTASSFSHFPGLPILHSRDLVNWQIIGHAALSYPDPGFALPQHGMGIWAPAIRYHNGEYRIYYGDPDRGVFMTKAKDPAGPWEPLRLIRKVTGWIDTCPFWDEDGKAYLVHAWANSRSGVKSIIAINRMNSDGTEILDDGMVVFVGHKNHPTIEGPKLHKRNGFYYIFAPAGGVKPGWQTVLRSRDIFGPYEDKVVLEQGSTRVNGPHQGAWVDTPGGEDWFVHFQDRYAYGRVIHLEPMRWENDWPRIGEDYDGNGIGEPVDRHVKPAIAGPVQPVEPQTNDEFDGNSLGLQWQWEANPRKEWYSTEARKGSLRLFAQQPQSGQMNHWQTPSLMLQKLPAAAFSVTAALSLSAAGNGDKAGLMVFGLDYAYCAIRKTGGGYEVSEVECLKADKGSAEIVVAATEVSSPSVMLRVDVKPESPTDVIPKVLCTFQYSVDGRTFTPLGKVFVAREGQWVGAKVGLFCTTPGVQKKRGYADVDWFRFQHRSDGRLRISAADAAAMAKEYTSEGAPAPKPVGPQPQISFACDRDSAVYRVGETAHVTVTLLDPEGKPFSGECPYRLTDEDSKTLREGALTFQDGTAQYPIAAEQPGFFRFWVTVPHANGKLTDLVTIAVEPGRIRSTQTLPDDFMEFWGAQRARLDAVRPDVHRIEFDGPDPAFRYEYVDFQNVDGKRFYFVMTQPKVRGTYPVQMRIPGAGIYKRHVPLTARPGMICVELNIHDFPINRQPIALYEEVIPKYYRTIRGKKERYDKWFNDDREKYYYNAVILGLWRTLDIACAEPSADQTRIIVTGGSQGGGLTLVMGALDRRIDYLYVKYPVFCDHTAAIRQPGRQPGWPRVLDVDAAPELLAAEVRTSAYYDNCNFARFITAPIFVVQGFNDRVCPPGGTFAAVAEIRSAKEFYVDPPSAHVLTPKAMKESAEREAAFRATHLRVREGSGVNLNGGTSER
jgi:beta-xylosidase/cephalosporin-C deacetylase-like acetyl esterase